MDQPLCPGRCLQRSETSGFPRHLKPTSRGTLPTLEVLPFSKERRVQNCPSQEGIPGGGCKGSMSPPQHTLSTKRSIGCGPSRFELQTSTILKRSCGQAERTTCQTSGDVVKIRLICSDNSLQVPRDPLLPITMFCELTWPTSTLPDVAATQERAKPEKIVRQETRVARVYFGLSEAGNTALL